MSRSKMLDYLVLRAVRLNELCSTNEITRFCNRQGEVSYGRSSVRRTLQALENDGAVKNLGDGIDAWKIP